MGEGLAGTIRACIVFAIVIILISVVCQKCHAVEMMYLVPPDVTMTDGKQDPEKIDKLFQALIKNFLSTHYHSGEIKAQLARTKDGVLIRIFCECHTREARNGKSNYLSKVPSESGVPKTDST